MSNNSRNQTSSALDSSDSEDVNKQSNSKSESGREEIILYHYNWSKFNDSIKEQNLATLVKNLLETRK